MQKLIEEAKQKITGRCLIAADVDKTYLCQSKDKEYEQVQFLSGMAPQLYKAANLGVQLAFVTGNSMHNLCDRFLCPLLQQLCGNKSLNLIEKFHFFCNSGGVYFHFPFSDPVFDEFRKPENQKADKIFRKLTKTYKKSRSVLPQFIDSDYVIRSEVKPYHIPKIRAILHEAWKFYIDDYIKNCEKYEKKYNIASGNKTNEDAFKLNLDVNKKIIGPGGKKISPLDIRQVEYYLNSELKTSVTQITLKPVLSWQYAVKKENLISRDLRTEVIKYIQTRLDENGLGQYIARAGGRSSVDVTLEKLDKAYALEFLIDFLNLQGSERKKQKFGSNAIYLGDEVITGTGNDYPVTRIPGLLVLAVNPDKKLIPFLSHVFVPSIIHDGPKASEQVITQFNITAEKLISEYVNAKKAKKTPKVRSALDVIKEDWFFTRIKGKINDLDHNKSLSVDDLQTLHAFITIMSREDESARNWLHILVRELDEIMTHLSTIDKTKMLLFPPIGSSHPDCL